MPEEKKVATVSAVVARGRTVSDGKSLYIPGSSVALSPAEYHRLRALGFVRLPKEADTVPEAHRLLEDRGPVSVTSSAP